ncbi:hypothetical protein ACFYNY_26970 [Streptomyces sp. NPDC006530]|uniref:hypothetical protein n=1 Tax=Streptomyces sp. NPDC006530 TaxID=3364750 RepID=UPI0036BC4465
MTDTDPVSRTILLLDIERFSDRDDVEQAFLRRMLYDICDRALLTAGIDETLRLREDRGDSVMELIDPNASVTALLRALLTNVPAELRTRNRLASSSAQIRLRAVVAGGYVKRDPFGWVGSDLNHACRLLDGEPLRASLRERPDDLALCVSDAVYDGIVRHSHTGVPAEQFVRVTVPSKNGGLTAWLHAPTSAGPARDGAPVPGTGTGERIVRHDPDRLPSGAHFGGGYIGGANHGISTGQVHGDIHFGPSRNEGE